MHAKLPRLHALKSFAHSSASLTVAHAAGLYEAMHSCWLAFALIFSLMTQLNLSTEIQQVTKGLIVLGAVLLQRPEARY